MDIHNNYTAYNSKVWDKWSDEGDTWTIPISEEDFSKIYKGEYHLVLTCQKEVPKEWYMPVLGKKLLGLASGGGQQMPVFAALGANVTVLDYSDKQLEAERLVAERENYDINIMKGDISKRLPFDDNSFDIIFNPVSVQYVEDVEHVWKECYRILKLGGILMSGFGNPFQFALDENDRVSNKLPWNPLKSCTEEELKKLIDEDGLMFSHSLDTLIGGQGRAGFCMTDLYEDYHFGSVLAPTYIATRAKKL